MLSRILTVSTCDLPVSGGHPRQVSPTRAITRDGPSVLGYGPHQRCHRLRSHVVQDRGECLELQAQRHALPHGAEQDEQEGDRR